MKGGYEIIILGDQDAIPGGQVCQGLITSTVSSRKVFSVEDVVSGNRWFFSEAFRKLGIDQKFHPTTGSIR